MHAIQFQTRDQNFRALDLRVNMRAHATGPMLHDERISSLSADGAMVACARMLSVPAGAVPLGRMIARSVPAPQRVPCCLLVAQTLVVLYGGSVQIPH